MNAQDRFAARPLQGTGAAAGSVAVLVSERIDALSGRATRNRNDALAVALALRLSAGAVRMLSAGSMSEAAARDYLALGAPVLEIVETANADPLAHSAATLAMLLAAHVATVPLVFTGTRARDRFGSGVLPYALAAALDRPLLADVIDVRADGADWLVTQALPKGARRRLRVTGPVVLAIAATADLPLRHAYAAQVAGRIVRHPATGAAQVVPGSARVPAVRRVTPLAAAVAGRGHDRMKAAVGGAASAGGQVIATGSPQDKAQAVLDYLRRHALVDF